MSAPSVGESHGPRAARPAHPTFIALDGLAYGIDHLDALVAFYVGDAHVHAAWVRPEAGLDPHELAAKLREAYRSCQAAALGMHASGEGAAPPASVFAEAFVTLEGGGRITLLRRLRAYVVVTVFDQAMPMGMARLVAGRLATALEPELPLLDESSFRKTALVPRLPVPPEDVGELEAARTLATPAFAPTGSGTRPPPPRPSMTDLDRARRILSYLEANAPEPHIVRLRVALRAGLTPLALDHPEALGADAIVLVEAAVQDILGIDRSELRSRA